MPQLLPRFDKPRPAASGVMQHVYDAAATGWQDGISRLEFLDAYADLMASTPPMRHPRVMDVGTGTGAFAAAWIAAQGTPRALTLLDLSPAMLEAAAARLPATRCIAARVGATLAETPPQDVILCAHVIEHLDDPHAALLWVHTHLRPGGLRVLAVSKPHWRTALVRWRGGNAAYHPDTATQMLSDAGFDDVTIQPFRTGPPSRVSCGYIARRPHAPD